MVKEHVNGSETPESVAPILRNGGSQSPDRWLRGVRNNHRAYMMSALRSFGWTLYNYCDEKKVKPGEIGRDKIYEIIEVVADENWLNYNDKTVCRGLCGTQDLHVYYLPDNTPEEVKSVFLPSQETIDETRRIQTSLPSYNPILEQVGSLDELRKDLAFIGDAVKYIYDELKENRDYSQPLVGNDADILYAWCALAYAARGPFFTEDGPMNCYFTQLPAGNDSLNSVCSASILMLKNVSITEYLGVS